MNPSIRVMIVDDEPNVRLVFRTALSSAGYTVIEAEDGGAALARLKESPVSVILLDLQMPVLGGMETLRRLRDGGNEVPVVIVTAHGSIPDAVEAMKLGAIDFLSKPLKPEVLRKVVGEVVRRHREPETAAGAASTQPIDVPVSRAAVDLTPAKKALNQRQFDRAAALLEEALELDEASAEAHSLIGLLHESQGQVHAAYRSYKAALTADPNYAPARDNMRSYCERNGLDFKSKAINPAAKSV